MVTTATYVRIITPDEVTYVESHYRTTVVDMTVMQALSSGVDIFGEGTRRQLAHLHHVTDLTKYGEGMCHPCGLQMWSSAWVAADVFGNGTDEYLSERVHSWSDRVRHDVMAFPVSDPVKTLAAIAILADLHDDKPALLVGSKGSVPAMERNLLVHPEYA